MVKPEVAAFARHARTILYLFGAFIFFAVLLFFTRYLFRGHLIPRIDQECHIGGIAVDLLARGFRFPLSTYAPNEYDNQSFFSGVLTAVGFSLFGRSILIIKLVTHLFMAAGVVATVVLLRGCLEEYDLTSKAARWAGTGAVIVGLAFAPRLVTMNNMYGIGNHNEASAVDMILLAVFCRRYHAKSSALTFAFWLAAGLALYVNKGIVAAVIVLLPFELFLSRRNWRRIAVSLGGLTLGALPEIAITVSRHARGWEKIFAKAPRNSRHFPDTFFNTLWTIADKKVALLSLWAISIGFGIWLAWRYRRVTVAVVVGFSLVHLTALAAMAKTGLDKYAIYGHMPAVVLSSLLLAWCVERVNLRRGVRAGAAAAVASLILAVYLNRPDKMSWDPDRVSALWHDRAGAACSWRFAEGFGRDYDFGRAQTTGATRDQYVISHCRLLTDDDQRDDCIGGMGRELNWRRIGGKVMGEPPAGLSENERRSYAFWFGTHRRGDATPCEEFTSENLQAECRSAVQLDCLMMADLYTRFSTGQTVGPPRCEIAVPPVASYWSSIRSELINQKTGIGPHVERAIGDDDLTRCRPVFERCF